MYLETSRCINVVLTVLLTAVQYNLEILKYFKRNLAVKVMEMSV